MKKTLLAIVGAICTVFAFAGCKESHEHSFIQEVQHTDYLKSEASCGVAETYYKSCECGEKGTETFTVGEPTGLHEFNGEHYVQAENNQHKEKCANCSETNEAEDCKAAAYTGSCIEDVVCECGRVVLEKQASHSVASEWSQAGVKHWKACTTSGCGYTENEENCSGGTATCKEEAICTVCENSYGEKSNDHEVAAVWDTTGEEKDEGTYSCCGTVVEFDKSADAVEYVVTSGKKLDLSDIPEQIDLFDKNDDVPVVLKKDGRVMEGAMSGSLFEEFDFNSEWLSNVQNHGEFTMYFTVKNRIDGYAHEIVVPITVWTDSFDTGDEQAFKAAVVATGKTETLYGYYKVVGDLDCLTKNGFEAGLPNDGVGFAGTLIGEKSDGSKPSLMMQQRKGGLFGRLQGATLKNIQISDVYSGGTVNNSPSIAYEMIDTTLQDVVISVESLRDWGEGYLVNTTVDTHAWLCNGKVENNSFVNVDFINKTMATTMGRMFAATSFTGNTFTNGRVIGFTVTYVADTATVAGLSLHTYCEIFEPAHEMGWRNDGSYHWSACVNGNCPEGASSAKTACSGGEATCNMKAKCDTCKQQYGELGDHTEGTPASCTQAAICSVCDQSYGEDLGGHTLEGTLYRAPACESELCGRCGEETGVYAHEGPFEWNTTDAAQDVGTCQCGAEVTFDKGVDAAVSVVVELDKTTTVNLFDVLKGQIDVEKISSATFAVKGTTQGAGGTPFEVALSGNLSAVDFSALLSDTQKHGEQTLVITAKDTYDETVHTIEVPLVLATGWGEVVYDFNSAEGSKQITQTGGWGFTDDEETLSYAQVYNYEGTTRIPSNAGNGGDIKMTLVNASITDLSAYDCLEFAIYLDTPVSQVASTTVKACIAGVTVATTVNANEWTVIRIALGANAAITSGDYIHVNSGYVSAENFKIGDSVYLSAIRSAVAPIDLSDVTTWRWSTSKYISEGRYTSSQTPLGGVYEAAWASKQAVTGYISLEELKGFSMTDSRYTINYCLYSNNEETVWETNENAVVYVSGVASVSEEELAQLIADNPTAKYIRIELVRDSGEMSDWWIKESGLTAIV